MNERAAGAPGSAAPTAAVATRPILALASTLAVQAIATLAMTAPSVMAPAVAPLLGLPPQRIGWFVGLAYLAAMVSGLAAGARVARTGPIRMSRWALAACGAGLLLAALAGLPGMLGLLWIAPLAIGLGYGLPNPSASIVLARHAPTHRRGLFFSIKQSGVPIGVGIAGLVVPPLLARVSWPLALALLAGLCVALALALRGASVLEAPRPEAANAGARASSGRPMAPGPSPENDADRSGPGASLHALSTGLVAPLLRVVRDRWMRRLGVASLVFSMTQLCFITFLVSYLKLEHGLGLATAAAVLSAAQVASVGCRVMWGQVADRWIAPLRLLGGLGLSMGVTGALLGTLPAGASPGWVMASALACAATSMAWNGVFFAELARRVRPEELATLTGGIQVLTFSGAMIGPVLFASLVGPLGSHGATYLVLSAVPVAVGLWLLAGARED